MDRPRLAGRARRARRHRSASRSSGPRSTAAARHPPGSTTWARTCSRPTLIAVSAPRCSDAVPARDPRRHRTLVPGLQRARRRQRPRQRQDPGRARRRRVGDQRAEGVDVARPRAATGASSSPAPSPARSATRASSFLLVPMDQPGVEMRPIVQITGGGEFNETFFSDARTEADLIVGEPGDGWRVAMGLLGFERGISTLAQQVGFDRELRRHDRARPRQRPRRRPGRSASGWRRAHIGLQLMRWNAAAIDVGRRRAGPGGEHLQAVLGHVAPRPRRADDRHRWAPTARSPRRRPGAS